MKRRREERGRRKGKEEAAKEVKSYRNSDKSSNRLRSVTAPIVCYSAEGKKRERRKENRRKKPKGVFQSRDPVRREGFAQQQDRQSTTTAGLVNN